MSAQPFFGHPACLLTHLAAHVEGRLSEALEPLGIQPRQFGILSLLSEQEGLSQHQLSRLLNVHRNVMVGLVDELEEHGLVERRPHPSDRRAHALRLLPKGRARHAEADARVAAVEEDLLAALQTGEAARFVSGLKRVFDHAGLDQQAHPGLRTAGRTD